MLGRFPALAGADLEVETGEVLLLSGPNGAGKTTPGAASRRWLSSNGPAGGFEDPGRACWEEFGNAPPADGCTVMMASHELDLARRLATREVRIVAGQVHAVPAPKPEPPAPLP